MTTNYQHANYQQHGDIVVGKLTDKAIKGAKPKTKRFKLSDGDGLYLVVIPKGSKWWRFDYRFEGKQQTISLGVYTAAEGRKVSLTQARDKAIDMRRLLKQGINPSEKRKAEKAPTQEASTSRLFGEVADDWLKTRIPPKHNDKDPEQLKKVSKTYARDARMVGYLSEGKETADGFGKVPIVEVDYALHLLPLLKVANHPTRIRLHSTARNIFKFAKAHGEWPKDRPSPFADVDFEAGFAKHKEKHRPAIIDPVKFGQLLRKIDLYEGRGDNLVGYALELLALTFVRPGTIASAKWAHFNLKGPMWLVPFDGLKMATERAEAGKSEDDHIVPLSRQAVALLRELHKITGNGEYLFPGRGGSRTISENTLNYALHGFGYKGIHCAHGFRSTASTMLNRERVNGRRRFEPELVEMQQDRLDASTRAVYDRDDRLPERIELMQFWADRIDGMRAANVFPMKAA
ncbi:MAG: DUF4102 domain-containing protein [Alphaproteobacteria bacterium]|nr:MAG: DUF4102 domain-containing protein [Alphaproteobacteria bacterium]